MVNRVIEKPFAGSGQSDPPLEAAAETPEKPRLYRGVLRGKRSWMTFSTDRSGDALPTRILAGCHARSCRRVCRMARQIVGGRGASRTGGFVLRCDGGPSGIWLGSRDSLADGIVVFSNPGVSHGAPLSFWRRSSGKSCR